jgi:hypothetical protein
MKRILARCLLGIGTMLLSVASYGDTVINSVPIENMHIFGCASGFLS